MSAARKAKRVLSTFAQNCVSRYSLSTSKRDPNSVHTADLVSFDAFDTLITRPLYRPSDLFFLSASRMLEQKRLPSSVSSADQWKVLRQQSETAARIARQDGTEVTLDEIYGVISSRLGGADLNAAMTDEIELERLLSLPIFENWELYSAMRSGQKKQIVISDIYLSTANLVDMLTRSMPGLDTSSVFTSSQLRQTKHSGRLFDLCRQAIQYGGKSHLHIGDNAFADVYRARQAGCQVLPYVDGGPNRFERILMERTAAPAIIASALAGSCRSGRLRTATRSFHQKEIAAISSGPSGLLLTAFVLWILKNAVDKGIRRLYFFARDGEILMQIAARIVAAMKIEMELVYLYVSRQSLHLPALNGLDDEDLKSMGFQPGHSLSEINRKLGLGDIANVQSLLQTAGIVVGDPERPLSDAEFNQVIASYRKPPLLQLIEASSSRAREQLTTYLRQEGMYDEGSIGVVDIGWKGRLQRSICSVVGREDPTFRGRLNGYYLGLYERPENSGGLHSYIHDPVGKAVAPYIRGSLMEVFCAARHGTTRSYEIDQTGRARPVLAGPNNPEAENWGLAVQQEAICNFVDDFLLVLGSTHDSILNHEGAIASAAQLALHNLIMFPTASEARALGSFPHAFDQLHNTFNDVAGVLPLHPGEWLERWRNRKTAPIISYWPEGSMSRSAHRLLRPAVLRFYAFSRSVLAS